MKQGLHGGEEYGRKVQLDFSVNINPLGLSPKVAKTLKKHILDVEKYPDQNCRMLRRKISSQQEIYEDWIICGNGASEMLQLVVAAIRPKNALMPVPTFSGYEHVLKAIDCAPTYYRMKKEDQFQLTKDFLEVLHPDLDIVFLCSPNNPVGNCIDLEILAKVAFYCRKHHIYLVIDECFLGFVKGAYKKSMQSYLADNPYLIIVRAFTKLYAMPGIRLGYLLCSNQELLRKIKKMQAEWSVSTLAQRAGVKALQEREYLKKARRIIQEERVYCEKKLAKLGCHVYASESDFILFETPNEILNPLYKKGILIRHCINFEGLDQNFYRIAIHRHQHNKLLFDALEEIRRTVGETWRDI